MDNIINNKKIAKNTLILYLRMALLMLISVYTSRVVLDVLGINDYGIYNVVAGIVSLFGFVNLTMTVAIRRYLSVSIGQNDRERLSQVFTASVYAVLIATLLITLFLEIGGVWLLNSTLNIPPQRMHAANVVFQLSVLLTLFQTISIPFNAAIVSFEKMNIYAYISVLEGCAKLLIVYCISAVHDLDKLIVYSSLLCVVQLVIVMINLLYCNSYILSCKSFSFVNKKDILSLFEFSVWSMVSSISFILSIQGISIVFNIFYGVAVNAALGVANQIKGISTQFIGNFQTAFNPQITKLYASNGLNEKTLDFCYKMSRLSNILIYIVTLPIAISLPNILKIWLVEVPDYSLEFTLVYLFTSSIDGSAGPLYMLIYAQGDIKKYSIVMTILNILQILAIYLLCRMCFSPVETISVTIIIMIIIYIARLILLKNLMGFPIMKYLHTVIIPLIPPTAIILAIGIMLRNIEFGHILVTACIQTLFAFVAVVVLMFYFYMNRKERTFIVNQIKNKL